MISLEKIGINLYINIIIFLQSLGSSQLMPVRTLLLALVQEDLTLFFYVLYWILIYLHIEHWLVLGGSTGTHKHTQLWQPRVAGIQNRKVFAAAA